MAKFASCVLLTVRLTQLMCSYSDLAGGREVQFQIRGVASRIMHAVSFAHCSHVESDFRWACIAMELDGGYHTRT